MEQKFVQLAYLGENLFSQGCPVLLRTMAIFKDTDTGQLYLQLSFENIVPKAIAAVKVEVICRSIFGDELGGLSAQYLDLQAPRAGRFGLEQLIPISSDVRQAHVEKMVVVFVDGQRWEQGALRFTPLSPQKPLSFSLPEELISILDQEGKAQSPAFSAQFEPLEEKEYWFCACGSFNWPEERQCLNCGISRAWLGAECSMQLLQQKWAKQQLAMQKARKRKKKITWCLSTILAVLLAAMIGTGAYFWSLYGTKERRYQYALSLLEQEKYEKAEELLEDLGDYGDSRQRLMEAFRKKANVRQLYVDQKWVGKIKGDGKIEMLADTSCPVSDVENIVQIERNGDNMLYCLTGEGAIIEYTPTDTIERQGGYIQIAVCKGCLFGLKDDGTVILVAGIFDETGCEGTRWEEWSGVTSISASPNHIVGLKQDGTVLAFGENRDGQCNVGNWERVGQIEAAEGRTFALLKDGRFSYIGMTKLYERVSKFENLVEVQQYGHSIVGLDKKGKIYVAIAESENDAIKKELLEIQDLKDIIAIAAFQEGDGQGRRAFAALGKDGQLAYYRYV